MDPKRELDQLYNAEYGISPEIPLRLLTILVATIMVFIYTKWLWFPIWGVGNCALQLIHFRYLKSRSIAPTHMDVYVGIGLYLLVLGWFLYCPTWLCFQDDVVLRTCAIATLAATLLALVRRNDTHLLTLGGITSIVGVSTIYIVVVVSQRANSLMATAGIVIGATVLISSFCQTLWANRHRTMATEAAARRTLHAQRLESVGRLSGGVAHDFNNVLAVLYANLELMDDASPEERAEYLESAKAASLNAKTLVRQLLTYSKVRKPKNPEVVELEECINELIQLARRLLPASIELKVEPTQENWQTRADRELLLTALMNLVINARDAMPDGGAITISLSGFTFESPKQVLTGRHLQPGNYVCLTIADTGNGIPAEVLARIAEPFFSTKPEGEGTGLGVYMVTVFAEEIGGGMTVDTSSRGTKVQLWLPRSTQKVECDSIDSDESAAILH